MSDKIGIIGTGSYIEMSANSFETIHYKCHKYELIAASAALDNANLDPAEIDTIIVNSIDEYISPKNANRLSYLLNTQKDALSFNIDTGCSSIIPAFIVGKCLIQTKESRNILVVFSGNAVDAEKKNISSSAIFLNGAGAVILSKSDSGKGIIDIKMVTKGEYFGLKFLRYNTPKSANDKTPQFLYESVDDSAKLRKYKRESIYGPPNLIKEIIKENGYTLEAIDYFILHQSRITSQWMKELGISDIKVPSITGGTERANMGSANTLVLLDKLNRNNLLHKHMGVIICEIGLGMNYGVILYEW